MDANIEHASDLTRRDRARLWHPYAPMPSSAPAVPVQSASGTRLHLADGRDVIDGMSSWWAAIHGYRHPVLDDALRHQMDAMSHVMFGGLTHEPAINLAERLCDITPGGLEHVFFADSGSVAVEVALKMALQYARGTGRPQRTKVLTVASGYHGDTLGCMSVCDPITGMHTMFADVLPKAIFAPRPEPQFGGTFNEHHIGTFAELLATHHNEVAAVILEPVVQGAGGMRFYAPDYLAAVRALCDTYEVLLIADEIATGFGRSGALFGCDHAGISPDIMCVGKAMSGGYMTMAAVICTPEVSAGVSATESGALMHGPTFMANPLAAAVSLASIDLLLSEPWHERVAHIEEVLRAGLAPVADLPGVADVRALGAIGVIEATDPIDMVVTQELLLDRGVWLRPFGRLLYTMPPYICDDADLGAITNAMVAVAQKWG